MVLPSTTFAKILIVLPSTRKSLTFVNSLLPIVIFIWSITFPVGRDKVTIESLPLKTLDPAIVTPNDNVSSVNSTITFDFFLQDITHGITIPAVSAITPIGINVAIISGDKSPAIDSIKMRLPMIDTFQDIRIKIDVLKQIVDKYHLTPDEVVYIGDDINDKMCLEAVKYKVTVPNANWQVKQIPGIQVTNHFGGNGAFREVVDSIICPKY